MNEKLVLDNMGLVDKVATFLKSKGTTLSLDDLKSAGIVGLIEAAERYEEGKGKQFSSFANYYIKSKMKEEIYKFDTPFSIGRNMIEKKTKARRLKRENEDISVEEISKEINIKNQAKIRELFSDTRHVSLDDYCDDEGKVKYGEIVEDPNSQWDKMEKQELIAYIDSVCDTVLKGNEAKVIRYLFGLGAEEKTMREVADILGLAYQRVHQLKDSALEKLRKHLISVNA